MILICILREGCEWKAINCHFLSREIERMKEGAIDRQTLPPDNGEISRAKGKKDDGLRPLIAAEIFEEAGDEVAPGGHPSVNFVGDQVDLSIVNLPVQFLQFIEI